LQSSIVSRDLIRIFLSISFALSSRSFESAMHIIGIPISFQNNELHNWIIRSGPMPDGSPGE